MMGRKHLYSYVVSIQHKTDLRIDKVSVKFVSDYAKWDEVKGASFSSVALSPTSWALGLLHADESAE